MMSICELDSLTICVLNGTFLALSITTRWMWQVGRVLAHLVGN